MGFFSSIGNIFKKVAGFALPALGTIFGGPLGGLLGGLGGSLFGGGGKGGDGISAMQARLESESAKQKKEAEQQKDAEERKLASLKTRRARGRRRSLLFDEGTSPGLSETLA